ncbi:E3 ubiquitin-protein ligase listerin-like [Diadema setosum]|uniref:E3 ubiquitin-protein ligase listerin-like n=1 Tax=Diadema setosum TaxID=31175 RepID=UPI003B3AE7C8
MSKKQKQRTKGNVRPSSSGRAAELLAREGGGHVGFVGFSSMSGDLGYVPTSIGFEDQDTGLDEDFRMVLRKLSKKDVVTKLKAIQEFQGLCTEKDEDAILSMLPHWPRLYNRLSMDHDKRVREATQQMFCKVVQRAGRNLAPHLRAIMGCWLMAQNDPYAPAGSAARAAFATAFPSEAKRGNAVVFCRAEILQLYKDNLFKESPTTLSDPKSFSKEEQEEKYVRVVSSSLLALRDFVTGLPAAQVSSSEQELATILSEDRLWKYAKHKLPEVRGGMYSLLGALCRSMPSLLTSYLPKLSPALLGSVDETEPATVAPLWEAVLHLITSQEDCWKYVNIRKAFLPKLWSVLRRGGDGSAATIFPNLLPLLSHLPAEVKGDGVAFYREFFNNFREGCSCKSVIQSSSENAAVLRAFMECVRYCLAQSVNAEDTDTAIQSHLIDEQLMPMLRSSLSQEAKAWSVVTIYQQVAALLNYLHKQQARSETGSPARVLESLWSSISEMCVGEVSSTEGSSEVALNNISLLVAILKDPESSDIQEMVGGGRRKQRTKIRFAEDKPEDDKEAAEAKPEEVLPETKKEFLVQHPQLSSLVSRLIQLSLQKAKEDTSLTHLLFLAQLVKTFTSPTTIQTLLSAAGVNTPQSERRDDCSAPSSLQDGVQTDHANALKQEGKSEIDGKGVEEGGRSDDGNRTSGSVHTPDTDIEEITLEEEDDDTLPVRCLYSLLLPWLLETESVKEGVGRKERMRQIAAILDMIISVTMMCLSENRLLVLDAVSLKAKSVELLHLIIIKMRERSELAPTVDAWLRMDVFMDKLLSIQGELCRHTLEGSHEPSDVGWKLISLALSSGQDSEPMIGTTSAELLLVGFYRALTRPDVVTTAMQCISFICDITSNFFSAVQGCVCLPSSVDLLLALFQLECKDGNNLSEGLREKVHMTWVQGVQTLVRQTGGLLTDKGLLVKATHWMKLALHGEDVNIHQSQHFGVMAGSFFAAIISGLPGNRDGSQNILGELLTSLLPSPEEWTSRRKSLPNQWIAPAAIGQWMTFCDISPLTTADTTMAPKALNLAVFISTMISRLDERDTSVQEMTQEQTEKEEEEDETEDAAVAMAATVLPWECRAFKMAVIEVMYVKEWCLATMSRQDGATETADTLYTPVIQPPQYCALSVPVLSEALENIWPLLDLPQWDELYTVIRDRSVTDGLLWSRALQQVVQSNARYRDDTSRLNVWSLPAGAERMWFEISSIQMMQTVEGLVSHLSESKCLELAEIHTAMLVSADGEMITSICGAVGNMAILLRCVSRLSSQAKADLLLSALRQFQLWREKSNPVFIFSEEELVGAPSELLCANIKMVQLLTHLVEEIPERLESHNWDFILCSLMSWIQACSESTGLVPSSVPVATLYAVTCDLLSSVAKLLGGSHGAATLPASLLTEWTEFFSDGAYSVFLPSFMQLIESVESWKRTGMDLSPLLYSACEAASHAPTEQLKGHRLEARLEPGSSRHVPDTMHSLVNHLVPLLGLQLRPVQMAAYCMLERVMPEFAKYDEEFLQVRNKSQSVDEDEAPCISPPTGLQKLLESSTDFWEVLLHDAPIGECTLVEPGSEAFAQARSCLLVWRLYLSIFRAASMEVRAQYSSYLKKTKGIHSLLASLFCLMPESPTIGHGRSTTPSKGSQVTMFSEKPVLSPKGAPLKSVDEVQHLACSVYYSILKNVPAIARMWWNQQDRRLAPYVDKFTTKYVSPLLCAEEIQSVQESSLEAENLVVKARLATREVVATYSMQDLVIEMMVTLPTNHPLGPIEVDNRKKVAVGTSQWRQWTLMLTMFLTHQNGSIMEGLELWRRNADKRFEGVEDCMICFSVIHGGNCSLPKLTCKTCKKRFHSACLYKWFSTSTQSSCPLCRSPF